MRCANRSLPRSGCGFEIWTLHAVDVHGEFRVYKIGQRGHTQTMLYYINTLADTRIPPPHSRKEKNKAENRTRSERSADASNRRFSQKSPKTTNLERKSKKPHPLPSSMPTIDPQITPSHEAARVADAKHRRAPVLLGHTELAQHILRRPVAPALGVFLEQGFDHGGRDVARGDGVDADAVGAPFRGQVAAELEDGGFGGVVGGAD